MVLANATHNSEIKTIIIHFHRSGFSELSALASVLSYSTREE
jgi:hypothetical protein